MDASTFLRDEHGRYRVKVPYRGQELLGMGLYNKGSAFTLAERDTFGVHGLVPNVVTDLDQQVERAYRSVSRKTEPLERYIGLAALQDRNETLFYRVLLKHVDELTPIVYTPVVGEACKQYSSIFRRGRGMWITPDHQGRIEEVLGNAPRPDDVRLIVVTDNERILGLGDQGAGGIGISIGKLALYTMAAGIHPSKTLPVSLDVGTDNQSLLDDPLYIGYRGRRLRGQRYNDLVEEFVTAVKNRFPDAVLQWEDFKKQNAFDLLDRYRGRLPSFNDDIQGTSAVAVAGILAACRALGRSLDSQRVVILGAGASGIGIARLIRDAMKRAGVAEEDAVRKVALLDRSGMLVDGRKIDDAYKVEAAWPAALAEQEGLPADGSVGLLDVIRALKPTVLIGTSGEPNKFGEEVIRTLAKHTDRPVVFPLSNPTANSEAKPEDVIRWSDGRALVATGSPFDSVSYDGRTIPVSQSNNVYVFPGVGLGALVSGATEVTDAMFAVAAQALAASVPEEELAKGALFPPLNQLRSVSAEIAVAVAQEARRSGLGRDLDDEALRQAVAVEMWEPEYPELIAV